MKLAVTLRAQHTTVEERGVGAIPNVVKLQPMPAAALLTPILGAEHRASPHHKTELASPLHLNNRHSTSCASAASTRTSWRSNDRD
jgi:hypothetical protein